MRSLFDWLQIVIAGEATQHSFIWGGLAPRTNPLTLHLPFLTEKIPLFLFFSKLESGGNPPNPAIWLVPRAGSFLRSCPLTRAELLAASFTSLFVVVNGQNRWFRTIFLLKLALLLALAREKWILLFIQNIWRENQASQLRKPLK